MRNNLILTLAFLAFFPLRSQIQLQDGINQDLMLITTKESEKSKNVKGSPYLQDDFKFGIAAVEGKPPLKVFMRYNVHQDQIEIKTELQSEDLYLLPKKENITYDFEGDKFILDNLVYNGNRISGYFIEHFDGDNYKLLEKPTIIISEAVKARTGYDKDRPARIEIEEDYYVVRKEGQVQKIELRHRDIRKIFKSDRAKKYLSDNKIRNEKDLISFISFLNQMKE